MHRAAEQPIRIEARTGSGDRGPRCRLEALWRAPRDGIRDGAVLAPPHPLHGGTLDSPVLVAIAEACWSLGVGTLRFNWRGVEGSEGNASADADDAVEDYSAALEEAERRIPGTLVACGYSWGAIAAARAGGRCTRVQKLVLVAPPATMIDGVAPGAPGQGALVIAGELDGLAPPRRIAEWLDGLAGARLTTIAGADHFFAGKLATIRDQTLSFLHP